MFFFYVRACYIDNENQREYDIHIEINQLLNQEITSVFNHLLCDSDSGHGFVV